MILEVDLEIRITKIMFKYPKPSNNCLYKKLYSVFLQSAFKAK